MKITVEDATEDKLATWLSILIRMKFCPDERHEFYGQRDLDAFIDTVVKEYVRLAGQSDLEQWCYRSNLGCVSFGSDGHQIWRDGVRQGMNA